ncbi:M14 family metallopeptidase [Robiginitomaculum antarcticum]|uniref:M14 family metallopeptidase n=1 Tax=Robiginitomaculum antarcticum TaxID=437507 RepID=UPI00035D7364|nr:M14-type cytosolic carboxypeptidase [Robiginitomaculum antarcticum]
MKISSDFDGGNIAVVEAKNPDAIRLNINKDNASDFYQWFYYRVDGVQGRTLNMALENAGAAAYVGGWENYSACASYDNETWFRVPTQYEDGSLNILHTPSHETVWYAYFAPYPMARHQALIKKYAETEGVEHSVLGKTLDGQNLDLLHIPGGPKTIWVDARQHPGESMAQWWMEGFLGRLTNKDDPAAMALREKASFYIVPNMNPDGTSRGNLRTNGAGANLNREWGIATMDRSPEVKLVMDKMDETGVNLSLDVHGDEALPYNFIAGGEGVPGFTERDQNLLDKFQAEYEKATPAFQRKVGYGVTAPGKANLTMATNYTAHRFRALSATLEMPFKDDANHPDADFGWSAERSAQLGYDVIPAMLAVVDEL